MKTEPVDNADQGTDLPVICCAVADASPIPIAGLSGPKHILRYVNLTFCLLSGKSKDELIGTDFCGITPGTNECMLLLDRVAKTGLGDSYTGQDDPGFIRSIGHTRCGRYSARTTTILAFWLR